MCTNIINIHIYWILLSRSGPPGLLKNNTLLRQIKELTLLSHGVGIKLYPKTTKGVSVSAWGRPVDPSTLNTCSPPKKINQQIKKAQPACKSIGKFGKKTVQSCCCTACGQTEIPMAQRMSFFFLVPKPKVDAIYIEKSGSRAGQFVHSHHFRMKLQSFPMHLQCCKFINKIPPTRRTPANWWT